MSSSGPNGRRVCYMFSHEYLRLADRFIKVPQRASVVHSLHEAYNLLDKLQICAPKPASDVELAAFHSEEYVSAVKILSAGDDIEKLADVADRFGLCYDCPTYEGVYEYASMVAGATKMAASNLVNGICDVAINWYGGWHHAKRDEAAGYCYFNDIVLGIIKLREKFSRILYVDLDLHHGDGVEDAFCCSSSVMTVSIHKYSTGFFPGSGSVDDVGYGKGRYYTLNIPFLDGVDDKQYFEVFRRVMSKTLEQFNPEAVVCQCGADGVVGDPMASFNLTPDALGKCVEYLLRRKLPLLLVGGGGYNVPNTARTWTHITGLLCDVSLENEIPEHKHFTLYGPDYCLNLQEGNRTNKNSDKHVSETLTEVLTNLDFVH